MNRYPKNRHYNPTPGPSGSGSSSPSYTEGFETDGVLTEFTVANAVAEVLGVYYNGTFVDPESYVRTGSDFDFTAPPDASPDGTNNLWIIYK